jgi:hypothetical protein
VVVAISVARGVLCRLVLLGVGVLELVEVLAVLLLQLAPSRPLALGKSYTRRSADTTRVSVKAAHAHGERTRSE